MFRVKLLLSTFAVFPFFVQAQEVGLRPAAVGELKTRLSSATADSSLLKLYLLQRQLADQSLAEDPHPIDTIRTEGLLQGDPKKTATAFALKDMRKMYALALAYRVSGERKYFLSLVRYLTAWAGMDHPRGDPIDDTNLDPVIEAYDMVKGDLSPADEAAVRGWLRATAEMELEAVFNRPNRATAHNNWHSHRLKIVGEIAYAIGDTALEGFAVRGLKEQIATNLNADGSSTDFVTRDALHYHVYDLEPLLKLAILLKQATGVDYYSWQSPAGTSIKKSVDWLLPYLNGEKTHGEFVNSTVEFDRRRAQNGEAAYKAGSLFDPKNGMATLLLAVYFDPGLLPLARSLSGTGDRYPGWQAVVDGLSLF
ncbi:MAG TPA: alginate lyase family protein [Puia sp.]|jgi:hypothetical protein|nr:alginate lyase family protein [Puia sp.]